jgi:flagellar motor switch protein FliG
MSRDLSNLERAALTLLALGKDLAAEVLQHLSEAEVKQISKAFMTMTEVDRETQLQIAKEFRTMLRASKTMLVDGPDFAKDVISTAFGKGDAGKLLEYVTGSKKETLGQIFSEIPDKILYPFFAAEHPQTVSFLLTKMLPEQAAKILQTMKEEQQTDVLLRISNLNVVKGEVVDEVREVLNSSLRSTNLADQEEVGGPKAAADILNFVERTNEARILAEIDEMYPEVAEAIRNLMFTFEDLRRLDDKGIQALLKEIPRDQLVMSLKTASSELRDMLFRNVSQRAAAMINEDLAALGPVKLKDVEKAQQGIIDIVRKLESEGKLQLGGGGEAEAFI